MNPFPFLKKYGVDWFILALLGAITIGYLKPSIGSSEKPINLTEIAGYGVGIIFFFYGLKLNPTKFKHGISNWKMHIIIQFSTFVIFPLILILAKPLFPQTENSTLWLSVFFLGTLPSTVSSSVVMVSIAKGNIPAAIFNATISSLAGIFITPLWMSLFIGTSGVSFDGSDIMMKLIFQILVPVILGSMLNSRFGHYAERYKHQLKVLDQLIILLIVYTSFCKSFTENSFATMQLSTIVLLGIGMVVLFYCAFFIMKVISKLLKFNREDTITVLFCGSKKSLIHGVVISKVLFAGSSILGVILLPIMLYHTLQLLSVSIIANKFSKQTTA